MIKKILILLAITMVIGSCKKWTEIPVPSYIEVDNYFTKVDSVTQGTNSQNFTDFLVYANGTTYGTYPMGSRVPILTSGNTAFIIRGVVEVNGVSNLRSDYEVMKGCDTILNVSPGKITKVIPVFEYFSTAKFRWMDDFEPLTASYGGLINTCSCKTMTAATYTPGFGGKGSCLALRPNSTGDTAASVYTKSVIPLPAGGIGNYLEFNYLSNVNIEIYIQAIDGATQGQMQDCGGVYASGVWKKMYVDLTEQVSSAQSSGYHIFFVCYPDGNAGDQALIDNIKVVSAQ